VLQMPHPMLLQDYLYGADLEAWAADGSIKLYTAFSRQQAQKVYVQQRLCESGAEVWRLLQDGAHFYVCGDAGSMASAVEAALLDIVAQHQGLGRDAARAYLDDLAPLRYQRDVWLS
jgi:sulfite reductase (NADPH) flavoprotein alpha-component